MRRKLKTISRPHISAERKEEIKAILQKHDWKHGSSTRHMNKDDRTEVKNALYELSKSGSEVELDEIEDVEHKNMSKEEACEILNKYDWDADSSTRYMHKNDKIEVKQALAALEREKIKVEFEARPKSEEVKQTFTPRIGPSAKQEE